MNLRDKLRAVGGAGPGRAPGSQEGNRDCRHFAVYRPREEFPGAWDLTRETLALMSEKEMPEPFDPRRVLYLDTETTGLGGSGTVAFLVGMGWLTDEGFEVHQFLMRDYPEEPYLLKHVAAGLGRFDIQLSPMDQQLPGFLFELKASKKDAEGLDALAAKALDHTAECFHRHGSAHQDRIRHLLDPATSFCPWLPQVSEPPHQSTTNPFS